MQEQEERIVSSKVLLLTFIGHNIVFISIKISLEIQYFDFYNLRAKQVGKFI